MCFLNSPCMQYMHLKKILQKNTTTDQALYIYRVVGMSCVGIDILPKFSVVCMLKTEVNGEPKIYRSMGQDDDESKAIDLSLRNLSNIYYHYEI